MVRASRAGCSRQKQKVCRCGARQAEWWGVWTSGLRGHAEGATGTATSGPCAATCLGTPPRPRSTDSGANPRASRAVLPCSSAFTQNESVPSLVAATLTCNCLSSPRHRPSPRFDSPLDFSGTSPELLWKALSRLPPQSFLRQPASLPPSGPPRHNFPFTTSSPEHRDLVVSLLLEPHRPWSWQIIFSSILFRRRLASLFSRLQPPTWLCL